MRTVALCIVVGGLLSVAPLEAQQRVWPVEAPPIEAPQVGPSASDVGQGIGFLLGLAGGYYAIAADDGSTSDVIVYGTLLGACLGLVGAFIGGAIGSAFGG
jgi:hypothetical protein